MLLSRDQGARDAARKVLVDITKQLGPYYVAFVVDVLVASLP